MTYFRVKCLRAHTVSIAAGIDILVPIGMIGVVTEYGQGKLGVAWISGLKEGEDGRPFTVVDSFDDTVLIHEVEFLDTVDDTDSLEPA